MPFLRLYRTWFCLAFVAMTMLLPSREFGTLKAYLAYIVIILMLGTIAELEWRSFGLRHENPSSEGKNNRNFIWGFVGLLCGVFVGVLILLNRGSAENRGSYTLESDNNGDGKSDATFHYERGVIARAEHDRNFDGKPDYWEWYEDGIVSRGETDDDFDGKIDGWLTYQDGNWWLSKHDTDKNGVPDLFQHFEHGVIKLAVWRPNEAKRPIRIAFYDGGVKKKELSDTTGDGLLDTATMFNLFEEQVSEEKLSEPLNAEDAIRGVPPKR